ncbi:MAG TPA: acetate kinase, partial [Burkholderiales bacterium]|nr:acetate kinase [Burkholderiales bacterium]
MSDAILVLNAGSSSIKYSVFVDNSAGPELLLRGQLEGLYTAPRFEAKDATGALIAERRWQEGEKLGHDGAIDHLRGFLREKAAGQRLIAVGHRVVHGGEDYAAPVRVTPE